MKQKKGLSALLLMIFSVSLLPVSVTPSFATENELADFFSDEEIKLVKDGYYGEVDH